MKKSSLVILIALAWLLPFSIQAASIDDAAMETIEYTDDHTDDVVNHLDLPDDDEGPGHDARDNDDNDDVDDEAHEREEEHENEREEDRESEQEEHSGDENDNS